MKIQYTHTRLLVRDFAACFRFYRDVLGFTPTFGTEKEIYADFDTGTVTIALFDRAQMSISLGTTGLPFETPAQDRVCLIFSVPEVDAACAELQSHGVVVEAGPEDHPDWGVRTAHFRDPDGNLIEINQPLPA